MADEAMRTVTCHITDKAKPNVWMTIHIGLDDSKRRIWKLIDSSAVPFLNFTAREGTWNFATYRFVHADRSYPDSVDSGIDIAGASPDGFFLDRTGSIFHDLSCGHTISGEGFRYANKSRVDWFMNNYSPHCRTR